MAPEMMSSQEHNKSIDFWSVGIILYQLAFGAHPFNLHREEDLSVDQYKKNIETLEVVFPEPVHGIQYQSYLKTMIKQLLHKDYKLRLNLDDLDYSEHKFFKDIDYKAIIA